MSNVKPLKVNCAVVGVGYLGFFHAQKYQVCKKSNLVGVFDIDTNRARDVANELSVSVLNSLEEVAQSVDAVTIASSTSSHYELAQFFMSKGIHVHLEKPMTKTFQEAKKLCELSEKQKVKFQIGHIERFNPVFKELEKQVSKPLFISTERLAPFKPRGVDVDVLLDLMIHDLDIISYFISSEPKHIQAIGTSVFTDKIDIINVHIEFESGVFAQMTASRVSERPQRKIRIFEKDTYVSSDFTTDEVRTVTANIKEKVLISNTKQLNKNDGLFLETESFVDSIMNDEPCIVSGREALKSMKLVDEILKKL